MCVFCDEDPLNDEDNDNNDVIHDICTDLEHKSFDTMMLLRTAIAVTVYFFFCLFIFCTSLSSGGCGLFQSCLDRKKKHQITESWLVHTQNGAIKLLLAQSSD